MCGLDSFYWALGHLERQARPEELLAGGELRDWAKGGSL